jgi:hypothetical protein
MSKKIEYIGTSKSVTNAFGTFPKGQVVVVTDEEAKVLLANTSEFREPKAEVKVAEKK